MRKTSIKIMRKTKQKRNPNVFLWISEWTSLACNGGIDPPNKNKPPDWNALQSQNYPALQHFNFPSTGDKSRVANVQTSYPTLLSIN